MTFICHLNYLPLQPLTILSIHIFNSTLVFRLVVFYYHLLTYICGHYTPIIGFRPALKLLSRRLCYARASSSLSHQAKSGPLQTGLSNAYAVILAADDRRPPHQTLVAEERLHPSERHGRALPR